MSNPETHAATLRLRVAETIAVLQNVADDDDFGSCFARAVDVTVDAIADGGRVLLCGNGGSAADAQHFAAELVGKFMLHRQPWSAISLADNIAAVTAIANDYDYAQVFARAVQAHGRPGDVLVAFSTSGKSGNVIAACESANELGLTTVAFVGPGASGLSRVADIALHVDGRNPARIQEGHKVVGHTMFELVERRLVDECPHVSTHGGLAKREMLTLS
jgi:D-sedoheptulose 7-phosphate isomerase